MDDPTANVHFLNEFLNPLMPGGNRRSYILKINWGFWL